MNKTGLEFGVGMECQKRVTPASLGVAFFLLIMPSIATPAAGQKPLIFDVSNVVVGAQRIETTYFLAAGKWSDASAEVGLSSTEIHCYKRVGFCEVASTYPGDNASLTEFDILRWDKQEMVAEDNSPMCVVEILRADFMGKTVTLSSADKGVTKDPFCTGSSNMPNAILLGPSDVFKTPQKGTK